MEVVLNTDYPYWQNSNNNSSTQYAYAYATTYAYTDKDHHSSHWQTDKCIVVHWVLSLHFW